MPPRGHGPVPPCRRGNWEGRRSEGAAPHLTTAPPGTARCPGGGRSPLAPPGRWRDASSGKGRGGSRRPPSVSGWLLPGAAGPRERVPGEDGVSRTAGTRRVLPGRGERDRLSGGMWPAARGERREPGQAGSTRPLPAAPAGRGRRRQLGAAPAGEGKEGGASPAAAAWEKVSAEGVIS